jgi:hypothetical protein
MDDLSLNLYLDGWTEQTAALVEALGPAFGELHAAGALRRLWLTRFDARGPHLFVFLSTSPGGADAARARLGAALDAWLAANPERETIGPEERERRHAECRGKQLGPLDAAEGFAAPGSYAFAGQPPGAYPFYVFPDRPALWALLAELVLRNLGRLAAGASPTGVGLRWLAAVDRALAAGGADPAEYWRYHATTLLMPLAERLEREEAAVLDALPRTVGERNRAAFDGVWAEPEDPAAGPAARRLVEAVWAGATPGRRLAVLREANHCALLQLGIPVRTHVPVVLYGWLRNLQPAPA